MEPDVRMAEEIGSPRRTKELLQKHGFTFKKSLGQNFLVDGNILRNIVAAAGLDKSKGALEIGPGIGALTQQLALAAGKVAAIELDGRLIPILKESLNSFDNVSVIHGDVLKLDLQEIVNKHLAGVEEVSVVANLPYYITTPILMKLLEARLPLEHIVVMIQKEVADRMAAPPGGKEYGSLSIAVQYYCVPQVAAIVPHTVFIPQPGVDSAVIKLTVRKTPPVQPRDEAFFFEVVQAGFAQRRKTLINNLQAKYALPGGKPRLEALLLECGIDPKRRGETLSMEQFAALSDKLLDEVRPPVRA